MGYNAHDFQIIAPKDLNECLNLIRNGYKPFAGGTDLMVQIERGGFSDSNVRRFVSLFDISELKQIQISEREKEGIKKKFIKIGACATYSEAVAYLNKNDELSRKFAPLVSAALNVGSLAIQNRGTIGGNIMNASPAADFPPALLLFDTEIELIKQVHNGSRSSRFIPYSEFHLDYKKTQAEPDEILGAVWIAIDSGILAGEKWVYEKVGTRAAQAISKICFAARKGKNTDSPRLVMGSVAAVTKELTLTMEYVANMYKNREIPNEQNIREVLIRDIQPKTDIRSTADYRFEVAFRLVFDFIQR